nr:proton-conducting transporter membrane subunit [uncultured Dyadobacter sp.]
MISFASLLVLPPLIGFLISVVVPDRREYTIVRILFLTLGIHTTAIIAFLVRWLWNGHPGTDQKVVTLLRSQDFGFSIDFYFDKITAVYMAVGAILTCIAAIYNRREMQGEKDQSRLSKIILLFYLGYSVTICSGNFETIVIGWEMLAIASFLLIAFYRDQALPVKNAVRFFSVYRLGDVGLTLAMWSGRHLWRGVAFFKLGSYGVVYEQPKTQGAIALLIPVMLLFTACVKSAQLPFSTWLPRAMESGTSASAILYGSLLVHLGVFLLLRTALFWEHLLPMRLLISLAGLSTAAIATGIARAQSSVRQRVAYASIAHTGLMFIEVAIGFKNLALFHFAGNAFLRAYQLLTAPKMAGYPIRQELHQRESYAGSVASHIPKKIQYTLFMLSIRSWNLDSLTHRYLWNPLQILGDRLSFLDFTRAVLIFTPLYLSGVLGLLQKANIPQNISAYLPFLFSLIGLIMVLKSFTERLRTQMSWLLIMMNHCWIALAILFNGRFSYDQAFLYLSGVMVAGVIGSVLLYKLKSLEHNIGLDRFHGHSCKHPGLALIFLLCCLGMSGFPVTPAFIAESFILRSIQENQMLLAFVIASSLILNGLAAIRIYARVFLGPDVLSTGDMAYQPS